ncbi:MAG: alpha/beta fold hydrolase [Nocardioidaceae bacterium]
MDRLTTGHAELAGAHHRRITVNGVTLHVAEIGSGPPVLLVHGFPQHWYAWHRVAVDLARDHRVLMPDMRGFGWSETTARGYDTGTRVDDLEALIEALDLGPVTVCGHEWGAWAGFMLALRSPHRVRGLVALNVQHPWPRHRRLLPSAWRYGYTALLEQPLLGRQVLRRWPAYTRWLLERGRHGIDPTDAHAYAQVLRQPERARAGEALHRAFVFGDIVRLATNRYRRMRIDVPTVLLGGRHDRVTSPRAIEAVHPEQPMLDVRILEGGHYLHERAPQCVATTIREIEERGSRVLHGATGTDSGVREP